MTRGCDGEKSSEAVGALRNEAYDERISIFSSSESVPKI